MPDPFNLTTEQQISEARSALRSSDVAGAAAYASLAAVDMLQQLLALVRDGADYEWSAIEMPGGGLFTCTCNSQVFTGYPTIGGLPYVTCGTPECLAVFTLDVVGDPPAPPRRVAPFRALEPTWERNSLVRYRPPGEPGVEYVALLQSRDEIPGWWNASVLQATGLNTEPGLIVGQGIRLRESSPHSCVARFPD